MAKKELSWESSWGTMAARFMHDLSPLLLLLGLWSCREKGPGPNCCITCVFPQRSIHNPCYSWCCKST